MTSLAANRNSTTRAAASGSSFRWLLIALLCLSVPGCRGCRSDLPTAERDLEKQGKKPEKPKPDFEQLKFAVVPNDKKSPPRFIKPGHWTSITYEARANNFDFSGRLRTESVDGANKPISLPGTPFQFSTTRPAVLPKGQKKLLETTLFVPQGYSQSQLMTRLVDRRGAEVRTEPDPVIHLASYQYYLVAVSSDDQRYAFLKVMDSVRPPYDDILNEDLDYHYRIVLPKISDYVPLPSYALQWTSIAYVVWDDIHPDLLKPEQRQAMLDWLHWGGQLIISGPKTLDLLRGSFLEPYLPATSDATQQFDEKMLAPLNDTLVGAAPKEPRLLKQTKPWSGAVLKLADGARFSPGVGELLAERAVGRGMIVVSAFRLSEPDLVKWSGYDGFINAYLLRRIGRQYHEGTVKQLQISWHAGQDRHDPTLTSNLRYFTRDTSQEVPATDSTKPAVPATLPNPNPPRISYQAQQYPNQIPGQGYLEYDVATDQQKSGVAGWSDDNVVARQARQALREAAGITVPRRDFVVWVVAAYLLVIVPVNWLLFRLIGRVEWAWIAVPLIALGGAAVVIRLAQVDIGFASSKSEVAVLEVQPGYNRGHLTRYTALYTSLSTSYDLRFADPTALALPLAIDAALLSGQGTSMVNFDQSSQVALSGFPVSSNSTGLIHSEQMFDLGGGFSLDESVSTAPRVANGSKLALSGAAVLRRTSEPDQVEAGWIGDLPVGEKKEFRFLPVEQAELAQQRAHATITSAQAGVGALTVKSLVELAESKATLEPGEVRLVGWLDGELAGVEIEPSASQARHAAVVIAHLRYPTKDPHLDSNARADYPNARSRELHEEDFAEGEGRGAGG